MSRIRRIYFARLAGRVFILALCILLFLTRPESLTPLEGMHFFDIPNEKLYNEKNCNQIYRRGM